MLLTLFVYASKMCSINAESKFNKQLVGRLIMKIQFLNFIFFILLFIFFYYTVRRTYARHELNKLQNKNYYSTKDVKFKNFISKMNFLKTKDTFLSKQGYPLRLDSIRYYLVKVFLALLFLTAGIKNYDSLIISIILSLIGYFFIDFYIYINKKSRDAEICNDLYNVTNSICMQLSSHLSLKDALKFQYENCSNKDFKKAIIEFSTCYELSELNIEEAIKSLKQKFDILEVQVFCNSLSEYNETGNIVEILDNLSQTLGEKQLDKLKENTRTKIIYITIGVIIALTNIILLIFYPLFMELGQEFNNIFK